MQNAEALIKVRQAITELVGAGILSEPAAEQVQVTLLQLLNETERNKQKAQRAVEALQRQIAVAEGEIHAWSSVSSVVQDLLNTHLLRARAVAAEEAKRKAEEAENKNDREIAIEMEKAKNGLLSQPPLDDNPPADKSKNGTKKRIGRLRK
jgi:hypothetical protein